MNKHLLLVIVSMLSIVLITTNAVGQSESSVEEEEFVGISEEEMVPNSGEAKVPPPPPSEENIEMEDCSNDEDRVFYVVEKMPEFPGGMKAVHDYIAENIDISEMPQEGRVMGKVYVTFVINKEGKVTDVKIARGVDPMLDREAIRVVKTIPDWTPGTQRGKPVDVSITVPVKFDF